MSQPAAMKQLLRDVDSDVRAYRTLAALLEEQFKAALEHDGARLETLAKEVMALADTLDERRQARVALVRKLLPQHPQPSIEAVLELLPAPARDVMASWWEMLKTLVSVCKARNVRNGRLMTEQHMIFQRVLHGEEADTYAAA